MGLFGKSKSKDEAPDHWGYDHQRTERQRQDQARRSARRIAQQEQRHGMTERARQWDKIAKRYGH